MPKFPNPYHTGKLPNPEVGLKEAVQLLQVSEQTVRKLANNGAFPSTRDPGSNQRRFKVHDLLLYMQERERQRQREARERAKKQAAKQAAKERES